MTDTMSPEEIRDLRDNPSQYLTHATLFAMADEIDRLRAVNDALTAQADGMRHEIDRLRAEVAALRLAREDTSK